MTPRTASTSACSVSGASRTTTFSSGPSASSPHSGLAVASPATSRTSAPWHLPSMSSMLVMASASTHCYWVTLLLQGLSLCRQRRRLRPPADNDVNNHLVGIEAQVMDLADKVKQLNDESDSDKQLKVFSIVGFGGLGKTTLAVAVCRQQGKFSR